MDSQGVYNNGQGQQELTEFNNREDQEQVYLVVQDKQVCMYMDLCTFMKYIQLFYSSNTETPKEKRSSICALDNLNLYKLTRPIVGGAKMTKC